MFVLMRLETLTSPLTEPCGTRWPLVTQCFSRRATRFINKTKQKLPRMYTAQITARQSGRRINENFSDANAS